MKTIVREIREGWEVEFTGTPRLVDVGIGSYEYWGAECYDSRMEVQCDDVDWDSVSRSQEDNDAIEAYVEANYESLADELCQDFEAPEPDYPDPEDD